MHRCRVAFVVVSLFLSLTVAHADTRKELSVDLKFVPQEGVKSTSPDLTPAVLERTIALRVEEGRGDATAIGEGTNDDDQTFVIRASAEVAPYVADTVRSVASAWGINTAESPERILTLRLMRFHVAESNKAVGSVYTAEVKFTYALTAANGTKLMEGAASGSATRYGRARSAENCNEVLSDSLKEAFANVISDPRLQEAWASGRASGKSGGQGNAESVEERLRKLDEFLKKGLITKEEYDRKRAEILKEL